MTTHVRRNPLQTELEYKLSKIIITELDNEEKLTLGELLNIIGLVTGIVMLILASIVTIEWLSFTFILLFPLPMSLCRIRVRHTGGKDLLGVVTRGFGLFIYAFYAFIAVIYLISR